MLARAQPWSLPSIPWFEAMLFLMLILGTAGGHF